MKLKRNMSVIAAGLIRHTNRKQQKNKKKLKRKIKRWTRQP